VASVGLTLALRWGFARLAG